MIIEFQYSSGKIMECDIPEEELEEMQRMCCCGDYIDDHGYYSGHSPVSQYHYWRYGSNAMD